MLVSYNKELRNLLKMSQDLYLNVKKKQKCVILLPFIEKKENNTP